jgi:hypothetical protein
MVKGRAIVAFGLVLLCLLASSAVYFQPVKAQAETLNNQTLGPLEIRSAGDSGTNVKIVSIQDNSSLQNPVQVIFRVQASLIPYCYSSIGNIGYSIDNGPVYILNNFVNQTIIQTGVEDQLTVWANVNLPSLSEGYHNVTVYYGRYFEGINQRYSVSAYSTVNFSVITISPTPAPTSTSTPDLPRNPPHIDPIVYLIPVSIIAAIVVLSVLLYRRHRKTANLKQ